MSEAEHLWKASLNLFSWLWLSCSVTRLLEFGWAIGHMLHCMNSSPMWNQAEPTHHAAKFPIAECKSPGTCPWYSRQYTDHEWNMNELTIFVHLGATLENRFMQCKFNDETTMDETKRKISHHTVKEWQKLFKKSSTNSSSWVFKEKRAVSTRWCITTGKSSCIVPRCQSQALH